MRQLVIAIDGPSGVGKGTVARAIAAELGYRHVDSGAMYRADGPDAFKPLGETEFVNGVAAMCASGTYGPVRACAGIVGHVDLTAGAAVSEVLAAHLKTAGDRFRGIRHSASYDADSQVLGPLARVGPGLFAQKTFREGYAQLGKFKLSFDAWLLEPQLPELIAAAADADMVIGSRYIPGGHIVNWPLKRHLLSRVANTYIRLVTRVNARDCTSGYRCWKRSALASLPLDRVRPPKAALDEIMESLR